MIVRKRRKVKQGHWLIIVRKEEKKRKKERKKVFTECALVKKNIDSLSFVKQKNRKTLIES
jgi:hypothetical protein